MYHRKPKKCHCNQKCRTTPTSVKDEQRRKRRTHIRFAACTPHGYDDAPLQCASGVVALVVAGGPQGEPRAHRGRRRAAAARRAPRRAPAPSSGSSSGHRCKFVTVTKPQSHGSLIFDFLQLFCVLQPLYLRVLCAFVILLFRSSISFVTCRQLHNKFLNTTKIRQRM